MHNAKQYIPESVYSLPDTQYSPSCLYTQLPKGGVGKALDRLI